MVGGECKGSGRMQRVLVARAAMRGRDIPTARGAAAEEGMACVQTRASKEVPSEVSRVQNVTDTNLHHVVEMQDV